MTNRLSWMIAAPLLLVAAPVIAQNGSVGYKFLEAVRSAKGDEVTKMLNEPGTTVINARDQSSGEGALHIVVRRGDETYLRFLLAKGADINLRDGRGNTPLMIAVTTSESGIVDTLVALGANVNLANASGETPLIGAVQHRDVELARRLIAAHADPDQTDHVAGLSARDYAHQDNRSPAMTKLFDETPKKVRRAVAGPKF